MLAAALRSGVAGHRAVFEVFARRLPTGRRYGVVAGLGRFVDALAAFRFGPDELAWLDDTGVVGGEALDWLADYRFGGSITAYAEGELYFPRSPVLTVEATFGEGVLIETLLLSVLNYDSAIASAAARMATAAQGRRLLEFGSRRTHDAAAVSAARAAYVAGFDATSNLEAGRRHGIPTSGTAAHAFVLAHPDETAAFREQIDLLGPGTTILVDTYDVAGGIRRAVAAAGTGLGAVRIDSGKPIEEATRARRLLDELGATGTRIVVSGDLDEHVIAELADAPVDAYGVGTRLVTGSGAPTGEFVYKLVAIADSDAPDAPLRPVAKAGGAKATVGGRKRAWRERDGRGVATVEVVTTGDGPVPPGARPLQVPVVVDGAALPRPDLAAVRAAHAAARAELPPEGLRLDDGPPAIPTRTDRPPTDPSSTDPDGGTP